MDRSARRHTAPHRAKEAARPPAGPAGPREYCFAYRSAFGTRPVGVSPAVLVPIATPTGVEKPSRVSVTVLPAVSRTDTVPSPKFVTYTR